ncbi:MAG TPA: methyltransferase [Allosphingosinicella sp.]
MGFAEAAEAELRALLGLLRTERYRFVTPTPATHARVIARPGKREARGLRDIFGWNLPFAPDLLPGGLLDGLVAAGLAEPTGGLWRSRVRVASLGERLFVHSAFPTVAVDAVFFGPDTYRFAAFLKAELPRVGGARRLVDLGAGAGAGGIVAAALLPGARITLVDVNPAALGLARVNAADAGINAEFVEAGSLDEVAGRIDLVIANPPYIMDEGDRTYRDGGGMHGAGVSFDWALAAARRLEPGGRMLLYTGVALVEGEDELEAALERALPELGCALRYRELDPDIFGEELDKPPYTEVERIAAVGAVIEKAGG